jgi:hypothetical protein
MVEHHHALTITESESADPHLATVQEGQFIGNHGKHSHLDVVEENRVPEVLSSALPPWKLEGGHFAHFLELSGGHNWLTMLQKAYVCFIFFFCIA